MADENLAYGDPPGPARPEGSERGLVGDTFRKFRKSEGVGSFLSKVSGVVDKVNERIEGRLSPKRTSAQFNPTSVSQQGTHRFESFAAPCSGNDVKWYVDGASYFWAVSVALERARESVWILDWWLSPELYLRRPPSKNEQYRLDRMLQAAAQRGVKVNVIVYKEVTQALTRKLLTPTLPDYLHSLLHPGADAFTSVITRLGLAATFASLEAVEQESPLIAPPVPVSSEHTKHTLESLHPNIAVFRHPDHLPDAKVFQSSFLSTLKNTTINAQTASQLPVDAIKALFGMNEDVILFWAHHEKLCVIDGVTAFMGGLDLCYGRWDLHQHPIADAHPEDLEAIVWPGQDFNNARIMDFADVKHWEQNKLDRKESSRMGWQDISIAIHGPAVDDLRAHFTHRWNFIYNEKYRASQDPRYAPIGPGGQMQAAPQQYFTQQASHQSQAAQQSFPTPPSSPPRKGHRPASPPSVPVGQGYPPPPPGPPPQDGSQAHQAASGPQSYPPPPPGPPPTDSSQGYQYAATQQSYPPPPAEAPPQDSSQAYAYRQEHYTTNQPHYQAYHASQPVQSSQPVELDAAPASHVTSQTQQASFPPPPAASGVSSSHTTAQTQPPSIPPPPGSSSGQQSAGTTQQQNAPYFPPPPGSGGATTSHSAGQQRDSTYFPPPPGGSERGVGASHGLQSSHLERLEHEGERLAERLEERWHISGRPRSSDGPRASGSGRMSCQIVRSATAWSNGSPTEHSIQNAYASVIERSQHFVYIENQFFITATGDRQRPVQNTIGKAIVDRILRAALAGERYKIIVVMPAIPAFAGDLKDDSSLGTRAIMEYQYNSINRGGHSIMEEVAKAGFDPTQYIRFYNLRNYDRINDGSIMYNIEQQSGVDYEVARREHDDIVDPVGYRAQGGAGKSGDSYDHEHYLKYRKTLDQMEKPGAQRSRWDTVSECYMLDGPDIRSVPWQDGDKAEIDCFVSEELYIHTKVLIADDRVVICGSANLNDRSQLGTHDSEIACVIEDTEEIDSQMSRRPWRATKFAATLRRFLFRKHLGLVRPQDMQRPDANFLPVGVPNAYDYGSAEDQLVTDPLADQFLSMWNSRARTNTLAFGRLFHPVPHDDVKTWADYDRFYEVFFQKADEEAEGKAQGLKPAKYEWGHIVRENFQGIQEAKDVLNTIKGTLVEMPLLFLSKEDIAKQGLTLNVLTEPLYT